MINIVVDCYGGDRSPQANIEGAVKAINEDKELKLFLTGKEEEIKAELAKYEYNKEQIEIINATEVIDCNESPTEAIKKKTDSSMVKAYELLKNNSDIAGMVTLGSTGAMLAGAVLKIGRVKGVKRPALCPIIPTMNGGIVAVCDSGANVDCDPIWLEQFAVMSSLYMQFGYNIEKPRVALLNIGTEEEKGDALRKETYQLLKNNDSINFVGNMESRDFISGNYDIVVCDGFAGNVLLKSTEGTALELLKLLKKSMTKNFKSKMGALLLKKEVYGIKDMMDYNNYPGAILLGVNSLIVKSHGGGKASSVYHSIKLVAKLSKNDINGVIKDKFFQKVE